MNGVNGTLGTQMATKKKPTAYAGVKNNLYATNIDTCKIFEIMKLRFELTIYVVISGDNNDLGKGTQTRKRKVLAVGVAGGSVCEKKDETENKVCQPCVQEGNIHIFKSNSPIFKIA